MHGQTKIKNIISLWGIQPGFSGNPAHSPFKIRAQYKLRGFQLQLISI